MLGLILAILAVLIPSNFLEAKVIWQSSDLENSFSFKDYKKIMVNPLFLPENLEKSLVSELKKKGTVIFLSGINDQAIQAFGNYQATLNISNTQTSDSETYFFEVFATTFQRDQINASLYSSRVWERLFILTDQNELYHILEESIKAFSSNFDKEKVVFYYPDPFERYSHCELSQKQPLSTVHQ